MKTLGEFFLRIVLGLMVFAFILALVAGCVWLYWEVTNFLWSLALQEDTKDHWLPPIGTIFIILILVAAFGAGSQLREGK